MSSEIIFDGDQTLNELVDELMDLKKEKADDVSGLCRLSDEHEGFILEVRIYKDNSFDA